MQSLQAGQFPFARGLLVPDRHKSNFYIDQCFAEFIFWKSIVWNAQQEPIRITQVFQKETIWARTWIESLIGNGCIVKLLATCSRITTVASIYVRGYHKYKSAWSPTVAREMLRLTTELTNPQDPFTVVVIKYSCVVGHVPGTVSQTVSFLLRK